MKKVNLALGAAGIAPALGLMMPAAAVAATHAPASTAKAVTQARGKVARVHDAAAGCIGRDTTRKTSHSSTIWVYHTPSNGCLGGVSGRTNGGAGLSMRTRAYTMSINGGDKTMVYHAYHDGRTVGNGDVSFYQPIHKVFGGYSQEVCMAIVHASPDHTVVSDKILCTTFRT